MNYCRADKYGQKDTAFPMLCPECEYNNHTVCDKIRGTSERTLPAIKALAYAFAHIIRLKAGKPVQIDPLDAALQAFRFTTFHSNLNPEIIAEAYWGRRQAMMDEVVQEISRGVDTLKIYLPHMIRGLQPVKLTYAMGDQTVHTIRTPQIVRTLRAKKIPFRETALKAELQDMGFDTDWIDTYTDTMGETDSCGRRRPNIQIQMHWHGYMRSRTGR